MPIVPNPRARAAGALAIAALVFSASLRARADEVITLARALELGRERAPERRAALADADSEAAQERVAKAAYLPSATASLGGQYQATRTAQPNPPPRTDLFVYTSYQDAAQGTASLAWTLWDFGKTLNAVRSADAQRINAALTVEATDLTVMDNVANGYMNVVYGEKLLEVAKATLSEREKLVAIAKGLVETGLQPPVEDLRAQARAEAARRDLASAEATVLDARAVLALLLGIGPNGAWRVAMPTLRPPPVNTDVAMHEAAHLPAVAALEATVSQYAAAVDIARDQYTPTLALSATGSYNFTKYDTVLTSQSTRSALAALNLSVPIFNFGFSPGVDVQKANLANAQWNAEVTRRNSREEAARAVAAVGAAREMREHAHKAAQAAGAVLAVVQARYIRGLSSPVELIEAESADDAARLADATDEQNYALQVVRLYVATGRKIEEERP